jgi:FkbM family methyltransferase
MKGLLRSSINLLPHAARHWVKNVPLVASAQRWLVNHVLSGEPFLHTINAGPARGLRFEVTLPLDKAIWAGTFEPKFAEALRQGVRQGDICYDIGGYRGYMSGVLALAGASRVVVCDPLPKNVVALKRLAQLNPGLPMRVEQIALGRSDGRASFKVMPDQSMGKLANSPFQSDVSCTSEIGVKLVRLDTFVFERSRLYPNLIKIDVEGAESDVLSGAIRTLTQFHPRVYLEAHSAALEDECANQLGRLGYCIRRLEVGWLNPEQTRHLIAESK